MKKSYRKFATLLLSVVTALSIAVPTLAVSASDYSVLNVKYAPGDTPVNSTERDPVVFTAYKVAVAELKGGKYVYAATEAFADSGVDVNEILAGGQITDNSDAQRTLLRTLGTYINNNADAIAEKAAAGDIRTAETAEQVIGTGKTATDGVAQFKGLADGLYLVTSSSAIWIRGVRYTPVPFLVNIPYTFNGVSNNYLTASVKFTTYSPSYDPDPVPTPTPTPTPGPSGSPVPSEPPVTVSEPPEDFEVEILDEDVPLIGLPDEEELVELEDMEDEDVPLAQLPQTGLLWWPVPVMAIAGLGFIAMGVIFRKKERYDQ